MTRRNPLARDNAADKPGGKHPDDRSTATTTPNVDPLDSGDPYPSHGDALDHGASPPPGADVRDDDRDRAFDRDDDRDVDRPLDAEEAAAEAQEGELSTDDRLARIEAALGLDQYRPR